jgi:hypothetical protein
MSINISNRQIFLGWALVGVPVTFAAYIVFAYAAVPAGHSLFLTWQWPLLEVFFFILELTGILCAVKSAPKGVGRIFSAFSYAVLMIPILIYGGAFIAVLSGDIG